MTQQRDDLIHSIRTTTLARRDDDPIATLVRRLQEDGPDHRLGEDQCYGLEWAQAAFRQAADRRVHGQIVRALQDGTSGEEVLDWLATRAMAGAGEPARSTSITSNLMRQELTRAAAKAHQYLAGGLRRMDRQEAAAVYEPGDRVEAVSPFGVGGSGDYGMVDHLSDDHQVMVQWDDVGAGLDACEPGELRPAPQGT